MPPGVSIMLYLDNAATTRKKPAAVYRAMLRYALFSGGNAGRGLNKLSLSGVRVIIAAQEAAAELFDIPAPENIVFTQNATHALNLAILGTLGKGDHIAVTEMDHNSVLRPAALFGSYTAAKADKRGYVTPLSLRRALKSSTTLAVSTHISNVCGTLEPAAELARAAHSVGARFLLDASQSAGAADISVRRLGCDMLACPGHKGLMGPMGTGLLYIKEPEALRPVICGGTGSESESLAQPRTMPDKFHSGTQNIPAIAGLCEGIRFILREGAESIGRHEKALADALRERLMNMSGIKLYGSPDSGIVLFNIDGLDSADAADALGEDIIIRAGYHCAPLAHRALGTQNGGGVRVSFGWFNTQNDVKRFADAVYMLTKYTKQH